jgi:hypothetical protein
VGNNDLLQVLLNKKQGEINTDDGIVEYMEVLEEIDEDSPLAELNAVSISDNNGGRIFL